jgi:copper(I)-binding protein
MARHGTAGRRRSLVGVLAAGVLGLAVTGCGSADSGNGAASTTRPRALDSVDGQVGPLRLLSVRVASPGDRGNGFEAGDDVPLLLTLANDGAAADVLTGASSDAAAGVAYRDGDQPPTGALQVGVPPGGIAPLREVSGPHLELSDLHESLRSGVSVSVTFSFRDAGSVTLQVPVATYDSIRTPSRTPASPTT